MVHGTLHHFLQQLCRTAALQGSRELADAQLLERFASQGDSAAFEVLVWRHGGRVLDVCRRLLHNPQDVEDAFQAVFVVLVRRARSIHNRQSLGSWLYKVAYRVALRLRQQTPRIESLSQSPAPTAPAAPEPAAARELKPVLEEEVNRLPEKFRRPVVLCYLQGLTTAEAARQLGCPQGTVHSRLASARERLRVRLVRRGVAFPAAGLAVLGVAYLGQAAVLAALVAATVRSGMLVGAGGRLAADSVTNRVISLAEGVLQAMFLTKMRLMGAVVGAVLALSLGAGWFGPAVLATGSGDSPKVTLVPGKTDTLQVPPAALALLGIKVGEVKARGPARPRALELVGTLTADPDKLFRVGSRFTGEVIEIGRAQGQRRPLRFGDKVQAGQLLAVVWSKDLAQKKAEFHDAVARLVLDRQQLERLEKAFQEGALPLATFRQVQAQVQSDTRAVAAAERTLLLWKLSTADLKTLREEADKIAQGDKKNDPAREQLWARVEIRAPVGGTIVEKNVAVGDVVEPQKALYQMADLSRLRVEVRAPATSLAALRALPADKRQWTIRLPGEPEARPAPGSFQIGPAIPPHNTVLLVGTLDNPTGRFQIGQFVRATLPLPLGGQELVVPASALVMEEGQAYVLVQPDPARSQYALRHVLVVRGDRDVVHVLAQHLRPGDRVVTAGAAELKGLLGDLGPNNQLLPNRQEKKRLGEDLRFPDDRSDLQRAEDRAAMWRERAAWSERMAKRGYLSAAQVQADRAHLEAAEADLAKARKK